MNVKKEGEQKEKVEGQMQEVQPKLEKKSENRLKKKVEKKTVIYIGASLKNVVQKNTTFTNGLPEVLEEKIKEHPFLKNLLVSPEKLPEVNQKLREKGSALSMLYKKSQELS